MSLALESQHPLYPTSPLTHTVSQSISPQSPYMNFWQGSRSLFAGVTLNVLICFNAFDRGLARGLAHTPTTSFSLFSPLLSPSFTYTRTHEQLHTQMWCVRVRALRFCVLPSDTVAPVFVCSFHWPRSTPLNPWEFVDQHLLKKLPGRQSV